MLGQFRKFSSSVYAKVFLFIVAIPFVFWGMGDVFTRGNTNNVAKINNNTISVTDFINHVNDSGLNENLIRENIDKNIFEEIQRSNMSKLGNDGQPIYREDGKIMKGPCYFKPDIKNNL